ncbi:MAG TPA: hypothetical protein VF970_02930, partial [Gemmatimonadales bacterium]
MTIAPPLESPAGLDRLMAEMHEPFLERASSEETGGSAALGGFLTLRFVDRVVDRTPNDTKALAYQARATLDYLADFEPSPEMTHLQNITRVAGAVARRASQHLLCAPLLAFAYWLEQELRLNEALDVVDTTQRIGQGLKPGEVVSVLLQRARILRLLGQFDDARRAYAAAGEKAGAVGDSHSVLLGRIGDAIVSRQVGNLPASEVALRAVLRDAEALGDEDAQARAHHDLGVALDHRDHAVEALGHFFAAFNLYQPETYKLRALSDVARAMKALGHNDAATQAFTIVVESSTSAQVRTFAMVELVELAGLSGDRVSFHRWRHEISNLSDALPAEVAVDLDLRLGLAYRAFGNLRSAQRHLRAAVRLAREWKLNEYVFGAETALQELAAGEDQKAKPCVPARRHEAPEVSAIAEK